MKMLMTGASGFLGSIVYKILDKLNYDITTVGISDTDNIYCNLSTTVPKFDENFDCVIHMAGKAHSFAKGSKESSDFFRVNLGGTINLLKSLEQSNKLPISFVFISSVAVYGKISGENIKENHPLNGTDPYALSKIQAEHYLERWCSKNKVKLGVLRPSLIAGKNPPGNLGAMINGIEEGKYFRIGQGSARKSILMAEDIAILISKVIEKGGIFNVCDDNHPSFAELEETIAKQLNKKAPGSIPYIVAKCAALVGDLLGNNFPINSNKLKKITTSLTFSNERAKQELDWKPLDVLENFQIK